MSATTDLDHSRQSATESSSEDTDAGRPYVEVSISLRTLLVVAGAGAVALALASIGDVLLMILVSVFSVAVLSPVASLMKRRLGWSRGLCSTALVVGIVVVLAGVVLVLVQAISGAVRGFSHNLPQIVAEARHSDLGRLPQRWERLARHVEAARE